MYEFLWNVFLEKGLMRLSSVQFSLLVKLVRRVNAILTSLSFPKLVYSRLASF